MRFVAPGWMALAAMTSVAVVAIHLIAWSLPRTMTLPTARFVPDEPARRAARTIRLADLALLALRVAVVLLGGLAMARPVFESQPGGVATVIAVAAAGDSAMLLDGIRGIPQSDHTSIVVFDTSARVVSGSVPAVAPGRGAVSLTTGLLAAIREARRLQQDYHTVRIGLVAPFLSSSFDDATSKVRALWPDSIHVVRIPLRGSVAPPARVVFVASGDDPVVAGIRLAQSNALIHGQSRVVREGNAPQPEPGEAIVLWPRSAPNDSVRLDAVSSGGTTAIGHYIPTPLSDSGRVRARWANGAPAVREFSRGSGCVRAIGFDVPDVGDFVLSPSFQRLVAQLLAPCDGSIETESAPDSVLAMLSAPPPPSAASAQAAVSDDARNKTAAIIMLLAMVLGLAELWVRRRSVPLVLERST